MLVRHRARNRSSLIGEPGGSRSVVVAAAVWNLSALSAVSMERTLHASCSTMHRKPLSLVIVLLLAGLAPATAIIGFCARMPCCAHAPADSLAVTTPSADCCTTIACYESPSGKLAPGASAAPTFISASALVNTPALLAPPALAALVPIDTSPPRTAQHRLALLSVFLI